MPVNTDLFNEYLYSLIPEHKYPEMYSGVIEYLSRGGKRFRPVLLFLSYASIKGYYHDILKYGAIIELFHNFTLIHDDIEDGSELRRGKPTLHKQYGVPLALNTGDALYTLVLRMVNEIEDYHIREQYLLTFQEVVEGQSLDIFWRERQIFPSEKDYMRMISKKTGALIGLSMYLGAYLAGIRDEKYKQLGVDLGIAFQIQDDLLNLISPPEYGKKWADDITEGKRTIMVIKALENLPESSAAKLRKILNSKTDDEIMKREAIDLIEQGGGMSYARDLLRNLFDSIDSRMEQLFPANDSIYRKELFDLIEKMKVREK